jgi:hypothetical protein
VFASDVAKISIPSTHMDIQPPTRTMAAWGPRFCTPHCVTKSDHTMPRNYAHDFDVLCSVQRNLRRCAVIEKNSAEESRHIGVDEITSMESCASLPKRRYCKPDHLEQERYSSECTPGHPINPMGTIDFYILFHVPIDNR